MNGKNGKTSQNGANKKVEISKKKYAKKKVEKAKSEQKSNFFVTPEVKITEVIVEKAVEPKVFESPFVPIAEPKLERSNSFFLTRKLSEIYQKLSSSKENLHKAVESDDKKLGITRSLSLNSIQLKKNYRRSLVQESKLGKLSEEQICENEKKVISPPATPSDEDLKRIKQQKAENRRSVPPEAFRHMNVQVPINPIVPEPKPEIKTKEDSKMKLERSPSLLSIIRKKVSFTDKNRMSGNWNTSLLNLQLIDNMVSYENMTYVNYDKFNKYGQDLEKNLSQGELIPLNPPINQPTTISQNFPQNTINTQRQSLVYEATNPVIRAVKMREKKRKMVDVNSNLDRDKNLYRQSIDSAKLRFLSSINLESHRWSQYLNPNNALDYLQLENCGENMDHM